MFAPDNTIFATIMLLGTMVCWGSWSSLRVLCRAEAPVFGIIYVCGQFLVGTTLGLTLGMVKEENDVFNRSTFILGLTHPGEWYRVVAIAIGGFCCANSDFLAACAFTRLPFAVVVPIFMGWSLMQATILNYIIEGGSDTNPYLLFTGVVAAFLAICAMAKSDTCATPDSDFSSRLSQHSMGSAQNSAAYKLLLNHGSKAKDFVNDSVNEDNDNDNPIANEDGKGINPWIYVSVLSGILAGLWSPLSTFGGNGSYPVDNPSVILFFFQLGSLSAIPFMLVYYGRVIHVYENPESPPITLSYYIGELKMLPLNDVKYGLIAGGMVSCGTYIYFTASQAISSTIAFAICTCAPLVTIAIGVFIFKQLKDAPFSQSFYLALSTALFISAISLMVLANVFG